MLGQQQPQSPNSRNSIVGWIKNFKRGNQSTDSLNDVSENELISRSDSNTISNSHFPSPHKVSQEILRPLLHHKARSANNIRHSSFGASDKSIRDQRDSFLITNQLIDENSKYFGVPLEKAVAEASAKISIPSSRPDEVIQYGEIPVVVAKCGVYIKKKGLNVEGIFRVGGASKRVKELQMIFNTAPDYGKKLNWDGYNVHDAASVLRRFLNSLPEPLIPLKLYEAFRNPLIRRQRIINYMKYKADNPKKRSKKNLQDKSNKEEAGLKPAFQLSNNQDSESTSLVSDITAASNSVNYIPETPTAVLDSPGRMSPIARFEDTPTSSFQVKDSINDEEQSIIDLKRKSKKGKQYKKLSKEIHEAIDEYKQLVSSLPELSKQLLFYILDLLTMVQTNAKENLMSSRNLAAIFQPSILSHPSHDLDPAEYDLSQSVVDFLIQYAYKLLPSPNPSVSPSKESKADVSGNSNGHGIDTSEFAPPKLFVPQIRRQHSKSLSSTHNAPDMVGSNTRSINQKLAMLDSDNESNLVDYEFSEDDDPNNASVNSFTDMLNKSFDIKSSLSSPLSGTIPNIETIVEQRDQSNVNTVERSSSLIKKPPKEIIILNVKEPEGSNDLNSSSPQTFEENKTVSNDFNFNPPQKSKPVAILVSSPSSTSIPKASGENTN